MFMIKKSLKGHLDKSIKGLQTLRQEDNYHDVDMC